jgi:hypothetical protein
MNKNSEGVTRKRKQTGERRRGRRRRQEEERRRPERGLTHAKTDRKCFFS